MTRILVTPGITLPPAPYIWRWCGRESKKDNLAALAIQRGWGDLKLKRQKTV